MKTCRILWLATCLGCAGGNAQQDVGAASGLQPRAGAALDHAAETIRPADFRARIGFLASDALQGRDTPSPGLEAAAAYIESEFRSFGLAPAGEAGTYVQRYPFRMRAASAAGSRLDYTVGGSSRTLSYGTDFHVAAGTPGSFQGGLIFVGRTLATADVAALGSILQGRAAVLYAPGQNPNTAPARQAAAAAGAGALLVILDPAVDGQEVAARAAVAERPVMARGPLGLPVHYLRTDRARELFQDAGLDFQALTGTAALAAPVPLPGVTAQLGVGVQEYDARPPNVVGVLEGSDPVLRDTYIVISAHMDHVGIGRPDASGDSIYNGADDDASGTSALVELAEAFATLPLRPRRSLVFLAVSGEEKGLLGSRYFADNPTVPMERVVANINLDMIGRNAPDSIVVIGQEYSSLGPLLHRVNDALPQLTLTVAPDPWPEERFFFRSDHFNFARREVPSIFFFSGVHEDYHRPSDHVEKIDLDKITRVARLVFHFGHTIASDPDAPRWDPAGLEEVRRLTAGGR